MKFSKIVKHLGKRGYVTRGLWKEHGTRLAFGMDNVGWLMWQVNGEECKQMWTPCLAEIWAEDWIIVDEFWEFRNEKETP